ncbi:MAG: transcriptional regulator [Burkholderiales bacterium]
MARSIDEIIGKLPKTRRDRIDRKATELAREMIDHADSLGAIRRAMSKTQTQIARELGVGQVAVAQLEKRSDLLLSTLQRYVRAAGAKLSLVVQTREGSEIVLRGLGDLGAQNSLPRKGGRTNGGSAAKKRALIAGR